MVFGFSLDRCQRFFHLNFSRSENWFFTPHLFIRGPWSSKFASNEIHFRCCLRVECRINKIVSNMTGMPVANRAIECGLYIYCINNCVSVRRNSNGDSKGSAVGEWWHKAIVDTPLAYPVSIHFTSMDLMCSVNALTQNLFAHKYWAKDALFFLLCPVFVWRSKPSEVE